MVNLEVSPRVKVGLRTKSALALVFSIALVLLLALLAGWRALQSVDRHLGTAYARNATEFKKQQIVAPVERELALSQRLADSQLTQRWLLDENDPARRDLFFAEAEGYRRAFEDKSYFVISALSRHYYFSDQHHPDNRKPSYTLNPRLAQDAWFFRTMASPAPFNINVDRDVKLKTTKIWFNVVVRAGGRNIGLAGTGFDLTTFLNHYISAGERGVTPMILDRQGAIQAHPDRALIDYSSATHKAAYSTIYRLLSGSNDDALVKTALAEAEVKPDSIPEFQATLDGRNQLIAVSYVPELKWYVLTAVDLKTARVIEGRWWVPLLLAGVALVVALIMAVLLAVNRIVLAPLLKLTESARAIAAGDYRVQLPHAGSDELGELTRSFDAMVRQVAAHTDELEDKVANRTAELMQVNQRMREASKKIGDSISYAGLIQGAILPAEEMARRLPDRHFVLWRPRDVVGGNIYVFRAAPNGFLCGIIDCAGHGVPGAFMTMIAHSALDAAIESAGMADPAALLAYIDGRVRAMPASHDAGADLAVHMDAGLVYVDCGARTVTFAGAKISLYWCDGNTIDELKGDRYSIGGKRAATFLNRSAPLAADATYYMTTDGLLDQAGGPKGYGFGDKRFAELMLKQAQQPVAAQERAFALALASYQGELPQRDDVTILAFSGRLQSEAVTGAL